MWPSSTFDTVESDNGVPRAWGFTGAFFGLWVQDMTGAGRPADFSAATCKPQP
ncbi:hypothetical protein [Dactylosporangium sp. NPDC000521]|uniref:beta-xylosidase family glycoside hydrolase n=1 Tax=Dactylosporangium sp. NPDC000521 TaxID=3363975 RepID=UPI0036851BF6